MPAVRRDSTHPCRERAHSAASSRRRPAPGIGRAAARAVPGYRYHRSSDGPAYPYARGQDMGVPMTTAAPSHGGRGRVTAGAP